MQKLTIDSTKSTKVIHFNGQDIVVRVPKVKDAKYLQELSKSAGDDGTDKITDFLDKLGFPKANSEELSLDQFRQVVEFLLGVEEKK